MGIRTKILTSLSSIISKWLNQPPVSALEKYDSSKLKSIIDSIADISGVARDEDGSFQTLISTPEEKVSIAFKRAVDAPEPGFALALKARHTVSVKTPLEGGGHMTRSDTINQGVEYNLSGQNVAPFMLPLPKIFKQIVGFYGPTPDDFADEVLDALAVAAPSLYSEVQKQTGLSSTQTPAKRDAETLDLL